ncbi:MAG: hypothetical protein DME57_05215 [Verrucomicrobia bacterium]|nr:MAG: hypothetical protein DME57_05215 [Verrucomicrobiota bacterium]
MKRVSTFGLLVFGFAFVVKVDAASHKSGGGALTPIHNSTKRGGYNVETVGDTLHQAKPENTRLIIRVSGADKKLVKPDSIALIDKSGAAIKPVFREDRKVGHEETPKSIGRGKRSPRTSDYRLWSTARRLCYH